MSSSCKYLHSPVHKAIIERDYPSLERILSGLPVFRSPSEIRSEPDAIAEEEKADRVSAAIDRRDVPNRDTPLHLAVKLGDETSTDMLMSAGADWSLQNEQGWSALQEAICGRKERIAVIIVKHYQPLAWAKWCRRLPRLVGTMRRMRDFYMEITFHFESSVIPFVSRVAPSDTYRIWKRGSNLRADMTLAGFDGLKIQRSDQTVLFLGEGSEDGTVPPGSLCVLSHKKREVVNALDDAGTRASDSDARQEVAAMSQTSIFRPGIDVTRALLLPQLTWRRQERTEAVGPWKAKVYEMHNVVVSIRSRTVPGDDDKRRSPPCDLEGVPTTDEGRQPEEALGAEDENPAEEARDTRGWFGGSRRREKNCPPRNSLCIDERVGIGRGAVVPGRHSVEISRPEAAAPPPSDDAARRSHENEYKKGLRPVLWLSSSFPLKTDELLPLLDILSSKVKAIRRLRELLTTKLPAGTFPVKVAIPVIPTVRVLVTFTKFEELRPVESEEFSTPPSSPTEGFGRSPNEPSSSSYSSSYSSPSWFQWMKARDSSGTVNDSGSDDVADPFAIPKGYTWLLPDTRRKKSKSRKGKNH